MTYCVGMLLDSGLVMASDSRTNAGVDHIATFRKMTIWETPGERLFVLLSAGNLAVTQAVVNLLNEGVGNGDGDPGTGGDRPNGGATLGGVKSMFAAARLVGEAVREVYRNDGAVLQEFGSEFNPSFILGGQVAGRTMRLFQIYAAGNFVEATPDTPFFQIGEIKYGKPILDRALTSATGLTHAIKLALVSMDSTMRSNISVGLPIDLVVCERDACRVKLHRRIAHDDPYFDEISRLWSQALQKAHSELPEPPW